jgi:hypothetical protein
VDGTKKGEAGSRGKWKNFLLSPEVSLTQTVAYVFRGELADEAIGGCDLADMASEEIGGLRL